MEGLLGLIKAKALVMSASSGANFHRRFRERFGEFGRDFGGIWGKLGGKALKDILFYIKKTIVYIQILVFLIRKGSIIVYLTNLAENKTVKSCGLPPPFDDARATI